MKTGLVLEGGAMRGMFTSGILDVMMENDLYPDGAIGVSAGATFGCNLKSRQIGRAIRYNKRFAHDKRYCSVRSFITSGSIFNTQFCYYTMPKELDIFDYETYKANPMPFYVVASDMESGLSVYHNLVSCDGAEMEWMHASASMPLVSKPVEIDGRKYLDGGITDSIPLKFFQNIGYEKNIVILTQPKGYVKDVNGALPLIRMALRRYPKIVHAIAVRHDVYNEQTVYAFEQQRAGNTLVLCPESSLGISRTERNPDELERVYQIGRKLAQDKLDLLKAWLSR